MNKGERKKLKNPFYIDEWRFYFPFSFETEGCNTFPISTRKKEKKKWDSTRDAGKKFSFFLWTIKFPDKVYFGLFPSSLFLAMVPALPQMSHELNFFSFLFFHFQDSFFSPSTILFRLMMSKCRRIFELVRHSTNCSPLICEKERKENFSKEILKAISDLFTRWLINNSLKSHSTAKACQLSVFIP